MDESDTGYSPVVMDDHGARVLLGHDHPGFSDPDYRVRRDAIASLAVGHQPGDPVPPVDYQPREHEVWRTVCGALAQAWEVGACAPFLEAVDELALPTDHVPQLDEVTERLRPRAGFRYEPVAGLAPLRTFYSSFGRGRFLSTQYVRHHSSPLYTPEPDIVHEVLGHAHQIASRGVRRLYRATGAATDRIETDDALTFLSKVFWFTIEFGVVQEGDRARAFGAGILSSFGELGAFRGAELRPLDFAAMGTAEYDITRYQPVLYGAPAYDAMIDSVEAFLEDFDDEVALRLRHDRRGPAVALRA